MRLFSNIRKFDVPKVNAQNMDPTKTTTLRNRFVSDINGRFGRVRKLVKDYVELPVQSFDFRTNPEKIVDFNLWLQDQINTEILSIDDTIPWTDDYIFSSYKSAIRQSNTLLSQGGIETLPVEEALTLPVHKDSLELLYTRAYNNLKGVTDDMANKMSRILADGFANGLNPNEIARQMTKDLGTRTVTEVVNGKTVTKQVDGITKARSKMVARTEVINAHANASLNNYEAAGLQEVEIIPEWTTAGDNKVCASCKAAATKTYTLEEARGLIPLHPNCRCAWRPKVVRDDE